MPSFGISRALTQADFNSLQSVGFQHFRLCAGTFAIGAGNDGLDGCAMVKKFTYFIIGLFVILILGSTFSGALEFHDVISSGIQRFDSFPESAWLIVLGALLISGATFLRRRRAARSR
jgi:LPXTG-motif cell wall-anchored protein